jgi:hypothetical protein
MGRGITAAAAGLFCLVALSFLPLARLLRYATLRGSGRGAILIAIVPSCFVAALLYERLVRGALYGALGRRLPAGVAAPVVALLGALLPAFLRLTLFPPGPAPLPVLVGHAYFVEVGLGFGLCWLALGTGSSVPGGLALGLVWVARFSVGVTFRGGVVPLMELAAAWAAALVVAAVLSRPLTPYREEVFG